MQLISVMLLITITSVRPEDYRSSFGLRQKKNNDIWLRRIKGSELIIPKNAVPEQNFGEQEMVVQQQNISPSRNDAIENLNPFTAMRNRIMRTRKPVIHNYRSTSRHDVKPRSVFTLGTKRCPLNMELLHNICIPILKLDYEYDNTILYDY